MIKKNTVKWYLMSRNSSSFLVLIELYMETLRKNKEMVEEFREKEQNNTYRLRRLKIIT